MKREEMTKKTTELVTAVIIAMGLAAMGNAVAAQPMLITLDVDVGSGASIGMGPGGMGGSIMTGGGPVLMNGQQSGTMMHSSMTATMQGMMGQTQTLQHRLMSFEVPGMGAIFAMVAGGNPWTGGKGIIMGGTDGLQGASGTFTVGNQLGPTRYEFICTLVVP
jgi:hypothetical protein